MADSTKRGGQLRDPHAKITDAKRSANADYRSNVLAKGGKQVNVLLLAEEVAMVESIMARDGVTQAEAIKAAIERHAKAGRLKFV